MKQRLNRGTVRVHRTRLCASYGVDNTNNEQEDDKAQPTRLARTCCRPRNLPRDAGDSRRTEMIRCDVIADAYGRVSRSERDGGWRMVARHRVANVGGREWQRDWVRSETPPTLGEVVPVTMPSHHSGKG